MLIAAAAMLAVACGKHGTESNAGGSGSNPPLHTGSGSAVGSATLRGDHDPTSAIVKQAFGGNQPAFPQLSKGGNTAAVELQTQVGLSGVSTYAVAFIPTNGAPHLVTLVDAKLVHLLLESLETGEAPTFDIVTLTRTATEITTRFAREGFTAFEGTVDELGVGDEISAGPLKLKVTEAPDGGILVRVMNATGAPLTTDAIAPTPMGNVGDIDCTSNPIARKAWFDAARKRVLLQISWNAGPDQCDSPDDQYRLWAAP